MRPRHRQRHPRSLRPRRLPVILSAGLALAVPGLAWGQVPRPPAGIPQPDPIERIPLPGPGIDVRFPDDPSLAPFLNQSIGEEGTNARAQVTRPFLESIKLINSSYDRCRALLQTTREAILSNQLVLAHKTLEEASQAAIAESSGLHHDQLLIESITVTGLLTDALVREGRLQSVAAETGDRTAPLPNAHSPKQLVRLVSLEWRRAGALAGKLDNPTYRNEYEARVAEGMSRDSSKIIGEVVRRTQSAEALGEADKIDPASVKYYEDQAGSLLEEAAKIATSIERPIWKFAALERVAISAGESRQFALGMNIAGRITNAEARAQAFVLLAESETRANRTEEASESYSHAAEAIARVEQGGLRGVLAGYLVDSLITSGRFTDARASLVLYPTEGQRFVALGAIAESQGRRGGADRAREWIAREAPPAYRSALYRRVNDGVLASVGNERQNLYYTGPASR
ncbi:hypothetical protein [Aquisphaera insulae]|uniref:hypothetical protein n=1 Tax=Aquisphaera insulae TaxID=2712864 RepID=UPI0013ED442A|nr:hypothetical protein [Aquisphaera insulae]